MRAEKPYCYSIKHTWMNISRMYQTYVDFNQATLTEAYVLLALDDENGKPSTQIAPLIGMEARSLTRVLKTMEDHGLLIRKSDAQDKRQVNIYLSKKGVEKRKMAKKTIRSFSELIENEVPQEELSTFLRVAEKITVLSEQNHFENND